MPFVWTLNFFGHENYLKWLKCKLVLSFELHDNHDKYYLFGACDFSIFNTGLSVLNFLVHHICYSLAEILCAFFEKFALLIMILINASLCSVFGWDLLLIS